MQSGAYGRVGVLLLGLVLWAGGAIADTGTIHVAVEPLAIAIDVDAAGQTRFSGPALQRLNPVGAPDLPWQVVDVLLPPDVDPDSVSVQLTGAEWQLADSDAHIGPAPPESTWQDGRAMVAWPDDRQFVDGRDQAVYGEDIDYPAEPVKRVTTGRMRQWCLAQIAVARFAYNPTHRQLRQLMRGEIDVTFCRQASPRASAAGAVLPPDAIFTDTVRQLTVNFATAKHAYLQADGVVDDDADAGTATEVPLSDGGETYVILTTSAIQTGSAALGNFITHKTNQGFTVRVVTEEDWGGGTGDTAAEKIRAWLQANYITGSISHVLLIGDPTPADGDVPMKMTYPKSGYDAPTDYYYADLTGDWDLDGDSRYGESGDDFGTGGVDRYWEVLVGRIPCYGDTNELDSILNRIIAYQSTSVEETEWRKNVLLPMDDLGDWYPLSDRLGEDIRDDILSLIEWPSHRIYDSNSLGLDPPPETMPCTEDNVIGVWGQTPFGIVVWWAHGSATSAADVIDSYQVDELDDDHPAFTFQASCNTAWPENDNNLAYALLRQGAICTIGATRSSWSLNGHYIAGEATIEGMAYEYTKRVTAMGIPAGKALNMLRQAIAPDSNYAGQWMNYVDCNIYGDPDTLLYASSQPVHNLTQDRRYAAVQPAIDEADDGDEIVLDPVVYSGPGNYDVDFSGKNLILRSIDSGDPAVVAATVLDARGERGALRLIQGESSATCIEGLTFTGANLFSIYCKNASPTVANCVFGGNNDRGIYQYSGAMQISDCAFNGNGGRGIYKYTGTMQIDDCVFDGNGGGIRNYSGGSQIVDCTFTGNIVDRGAGVETSGGETLISGCTFIGNTATADGGGIYGSGTNLYDLTIRDCLFTGNVAGEEGGGLHINNNVHLINNLIVGNTAANHGGGVMTMFGDASLTNCTLMLNRADVGGGMAAQGSTADVDNSIFWQNESADTGDQMALFTPYSSATTVQLGFCDLSGGEAGVYIEGQSCTFSAVDCIDADPLVVHPGRWDDNATPADTEDDIWTAGDYHLTAASSCIDAGNDAAVDLPVLDMDGDPRSLDGDGDGTEAVDIGADEFVAAGGCPSDRDGDGDVDGADLFLLAGDPAVLDLGAFAGDFGSEVCE